MGRDWEATLRDWVKPPSSTEEAKTEKTEKEIRAALAEYGPLPNAAMRVFAQGSYKNNTNVRLDYDVDIAVEFQEGQRQPTMEPNIFVVKQNAAAANLTLEQLGLTVPSGEPVFRPAWFKSHVERALVDAFGRTNVVRRGKCIKIKAGNTTLPADVVPCFPLRRYDSPSSSSRGIRIFPDDGPAIENYPEQHYARGCEKNERTGRRYKRMVRALKRMENELVQLGAIPKELPSFLMECLVYNVPDSHFDGGNYASVFRRVVLEIWHSTAEPERCGGWVEVSELKYLFAPTQPWTREEANGLALAAFTMVRDV